MSNYFKVASVPSDAYTNTNLVYFNTADLGKVGQRVIVAGFPYNTAGDANVAVGTIAMNGIQRKCCGVSTVAGDTIEIPMGGYKPAAPSTILTMKVEMEYVVASKKGGTLDVQLVAKFFDNMFAGQMFAANQTVACVLDSKYIARVVSIEALDKTGADLTLAEFVKGETMVMVSAKEKCEITLVNQRDVDVDAVAPQLIQKFDLENLGIGGLRAEFGQVFRRAFASRIMPPSVVKRLGIPHVKGVLLYGPPGTGKTLIARKIGEILNTCPPKIVSGPELLDKFVGGTEANVRKLFAEAEAEQQAKGEQSKLHLIIFDEFDSICKQRGSVRDGTGVADNVVNQLLAKIDGVNTLNNVLLIGMTNRKDLIDDAILRPGRFEVHVEIGLPDEPGRVEVFRIHTRQMRENGTLASDIDYNELARNSKNFSGAEIAGVVRSATSYALERHVDFENPATVTAQSAVDLEVTMGDFRKALSEIKPAFGAAKDECDILMRSGIIGYGPAWDYAEKQAMSFIEHISAEKSKLNLLSVLFEGSVGSGKSAFAAHVGLTSNFPFVKLISNDTLVTYGETQKANIIRKAFEDAYKSKLSVIVLDDIERLVEYSHLGGRYSNLLLQTLLVLIKRQPPAGHKLIVLGTTSLPDVMESLELTSVFSTSLHVTEVDPSNIPEVARGLGVRFATPQDAASIVSNMLGSVPIKKLLLVMELADEEYKGISEKSWRIAMESVSLGDKYA